MLTYASHSPWTDPGEHRHRLAELPGGPAELPDALEQFVIHHAAARAVGYGVPAPRRAIAACAR
jgi:hypothetical protein